MEPEPRARRTIVLPRSEHAVLDEDDFGAPGLVAHEVIGPFVRLQASGPLVMVHDGVFEPRRGIGHHPHRMHERLFYILEGAVEHDDALNGITGHMGTGDLGRLTEGRRGMLHREWNETDGRTRAFILVYATDPVPAAASFEVLREADAPRSDPRPGVRTKELVGPASPLRIHGDVRLFTDDRMEPGARGELVLGEGEGGLLFVVEGAIELEGERVPAEAAAVVPPGEAARRLPYGAPEGARVLRVVHGPGFGLVTGEPMPRPGG